jgi:glutathionylspermidine synthase
LGNAYARKPLLSREGANIRLRSASDLTDTSGQYGEEGFVYQELCMLPKFGQRFAVVGAWVVGDAAHGMGIREDASPVTQNMSTFVPHYFVD